jgi:hypothetical protein
MRNIFNYFMGKFRTTKNTEVIVFNKGGFVGSLGLSKKLYKRYVEAGNKLRKNEPLTASDKTHLYGYLNPYYRAAYSLPKHRK